MRDAIRVILLLLLFAAVMTVLAACDEPDPNAEGFITEAEAAKIALEHAGFSSKEVDKLRGRLKDDDGVNYYDIYFRVGHSEYDYEIEAVSGEVLKYEVD